MSATPGKRAMDRSRFCGFETLPVRITIHVGRALMTLERLGRLAKGDVVTLDRAVGKPFELRAGEIALGAVEPLAIGDHLAVKLIGCVENDGTGDGDGSGA